MDRRSIFIGFEPKEHDAFTVARRSFIQRSLLFGARIAGLQLADLRRRGLYYRPTTKVDGKLFDTISDAPMSTEFANSRFLAPELMRQMWQRDRGWVLFTDCDVLVRHSLQPLFEQAEAEPDKAVFCVKHQHEPSVGIKMDGQQQTRYARKNWSSVMLLNCDHPANDKLTVELVNTVPGRDLHRFCWLEDDLIGELHPKWNWLVGHSDKKIDPAIVHFTEGVPSLPGYENVPFADEWRATLSWDVVRWEAA